MSRQLLRIYIGMKLASQWSSRDRIEATSCYIDYRHSRNDYLSACWDLVNWKVVAERYAQLSFSDDPITVVARAPAARRG